MRSASVLASISSLLIFGFASSALAVPCDNPDPAFDSPETDCANGPAGDEQPDASQINDLLSARHAGNYFAGDTTSGGDEWTTIMTQLTGSGSGSYGVVLNVEDLWVDLGDLFTLYDEIAIAIKTGSGGEGQSGIFWSVYLMDPTDADGIYDFSACGSACTGRGFSGMYFFGRGEPELDVPEPGTLGLLGLGLAGLGFGFRRRRKI